MRSGIILSILVTVLLGCGKGNTNMDGTFNGPLSDCLTHHVCTYNYYDHAGYQGSYPQVVAAGDRVFTYKSIDSSVCDLSKQLFFKSPLNNSSFVISGSQISAGGVTYSESCACCDFAYIPKPIGGEIKGKRTGDNRWLINATVILADPSNKPIDTLTVNQYFILKNL